MTEDVAKVMTDPNYVVEFAVGSPLPELPQQSHDSGIRLGGVYYDRVKRYIFKSTKFSRKDVRIFDHETGETVYVSHHPGKNPLEVVDPLDIANTGALFDQYGGEWKSLTDVTGYHGMPSFSIRPKAVSLHGRQFIKVQEEDIFSIAKIGKLKTMSIRPQFTVGKGKDTEMVYKCVADIIGRTVSIRNTDGEILAQMCKTRKAMVQTVLFGSGSESTIDIAPGVDCSTILGILFGIQQVGEHIMSDAFNNYLVDPVNDNIITAAMERASKFVAGDDDDDDDDDDGRDNDGGEKPGEIKESMKGEEEQSEYAGGKNGNLEEEKDEDIVELEEDYAESVDDDDEHSEDEDFDDSGVLEGAREMIRRLTRRFTGIDDEENEEDKDEAESKEAER